MFPSSAPLLLFLIFSLSSLLSIFPLLLWYFSLSVKLRWSLRFGLFVPPPFPRQWSSSLFPSSALARQTTAPLEQVLILRSGHLKTRSVNHSRSDHHTRHTTISIGLSSTHRPPLLPDRAPRAGSRLARPNRKPPAVPRRVSPPLCAAITRSSSSPPAALLCSPSPDPTVAYCCWVLLCA